MKGYNGILKCSKWERSVMTGKCLFSSFIGKSRATLLVVLFHCQIYIDSSQPTCTQNNMYSFLLYRYVKCESKSKWNMWGRRSEYNTKKKNISSLRENDDGDVTCFTIPFHQPIFVFSMHALLNEHFWCMNFFILLYNYYTL